MANVSGPVVQRYASFETRLVAFLLDLIVLVSVLALFLGVALLQFLLSSDGGVEDPPDAAVYAAAVILLLYLFPFLPLYFLGMWTWRGQTVGKMAMAIKVARRDGGPVGLARAALRLGGLNCLPLIFLASLLSLLGPKRIEDALVALTWGLLVATLVLIAIQVVGFLTIPFNRDRQGLHDRLADTVVLDLT